jgi:hypothetical protein
MIINDHDAYALLRHHVEAFSKMTDEDWQMLLPHLAIKAIAANQG